MLFSYDKQNYLWLPSYLSCQAKVDGRECLSVPGVDMTTLTLNACLRFRILRSQFLTMVALSCCMNEASLLSSEAATIGLLEEPTASMFMVSYPTFDCLISKERFLISFSAVREQQLQLHRANEFYKFIYRARIDAPLINFTIMTDKLISDFRKKMFTFICSY